MSTSGRKPSDDDDQKKGGGKLPDALTPRSYELLAKMIAKHTGQSESDVLESLRSGHGKDGISELLRLSNGTEGIGELLRPSKGTDKISELVARPPSASAGGARRESASGTSGQPMLAKSLDPLRFEDRLGKPSGGASSPLGLPGDPYLSRPGGHSSVGSGGCLLVPVTLVLLGAALALAVLLR